MARAGFLHCATSGNAAAAMRVRLLPCGKAGRFLLAPLEAKSGSSRPSPSGPRSAAPQKDRTRPFSPHSGFAELSKPGCDPLFSMGIRSLFSTLFAGRPVFDRELC